MKENLVEEISEAFLTKIVDILDYYKEDLLEMFLETDNSMDKALEQILEQILRQITKEKILARIEQEREEQEVM